MRGRNVRSHCITKRVSLVRHVAAKNVFFSRRQDTRTRLSTQPCHLQADCHVHGVDIRAFLAINPDCDKILVDPCGQLIIFERFVQHYMTPEACGVPYRARDRFILAGGPGKSFVAPWVPDHGIFRMQGKEGALRVGQVVWLSAVMVSRNCSGTLRLRHPKNTRYSLVT